MKKLILLFLMLMPILAFAQGNGRTNYWSVASPTSIKYDGGKVVFDTLVLGNKANAGVLEMLYKQSSTSPVYQLLFKWQSRYNQTLFVPAYAGVDTIALKSDLKKGVGSGIVTPDTVSKYYQLPMWKNADHMSWKDSLNSMVMKIDSLMYKSVVYTDTTQLIIVNDTLKLNPRLELGTGGIVAPDGHTQYYNLAQWSSNGTAWKDSLNKTFSNIDKLMYDGVVYTDTTQLIIVNDTLKLNSNISIGGSGNMVSSDKTTPNYKLPQWTSGGIAWKDSLNSAFLKIDTLMHNAVVYTDTTQLLITNDTLHLNPRFALGGSGIVAPDGHTPNYQLSQWSSSGTAWKDSLNKTFFSIDKLINDAIVFTNQDQLIIRNDTLMFNPDLPIAGGSGITAPDSSTKYYGLAQWKRNGSTWRDSLNSTFNKLDTLLYNAVVFTDTTQLVMINDTLKLNPNLSLSGGIVAPDKKTEIYGLPQWTSTGQAWKDSLNNAFSRLDQLLYKAVVYTDTSQIIMENDTLKLNPRLELSGGGITAPDNHTVNYGLSQWSSNGVAWKDSLNKSFVTIDTLLYKGIVYTDTTQLVIVNDTLKLNPNLSLSGGIVAPSSVTSNYKLPQWTPDGSAWRDSLNSAFKKIDTLMSNAVVFTDTTEMYITNDTLHLNPRFALGGNGNIVAPDRATPNYKLSQWSSDGQAWKDSLNNTFGTIDRVINNAVVYTDTSQLIIRNDTLQFNQNYVGKANIVAPDKKTAIYGLPQWTSDGQAWKDSLNKAFTALDTLLYNAVVYTDTTQLVMVNDTLKLNPNLKLGSNLNIDTTQFAMVNDTLKLKNSYVSADSATFNNSIDVKENVIASYVKSRTVEADNLFLNGDFYPNNVYAGGSIASDGDLSGNKVTGNSFVAYRDGTEYSVLDSALMVERFPNLTATLIDSSKIATMFPNVKAELIDSSKIVDMFPNVKAELIDSSKIATMFPNVKDTLVKSFTQLSDVPNTYSGNIGKVLKVNNDGTGLIFGDDNTSSGDTTGEANTLTSLGSGTSIVAGKVGVDLQVKSLVGGTGVSLSNNGTTVTINSTVTPGETNTLGTVGTGESIVGTKSGTVLNTKSLKAGTNVSLSSDANSVTITATGDGGENNTLGTLGGGTSIVGTKSGTVLNTKSLVNGSGINITNDANTVTIASTVVPGETNTISSVGNGKTLVHGKVGSDLQTKSLVAGTNVTLTSDTNTVTINATGGGSGEANTLSSVGMGSSIVYGKDGVDLQTKSLLSGDGINIEDYDGLSLKINSTVVPGETNTISSVGAGTSIVSGKVGADLQVKSLVGSGATLTSDANTVTITVPTEIPTMTDNSGKFLTNNGATAFWQTLPASGETNTISSVGGGTSVVSGKVGSDLQVKSLVNGSGINITNDANTVTIASTVVPGETNTLGTLGAGTSIAGAKSGTVLNTKSLVNGSGINITSDANTVTIASTVTAGETNTLGTLGAGQSIVGTKSGTVLNTKSLVAGTNVTLSSDANTVTINATGGGSGEANTLTSVGSGTSIVSGKVGVDLQTKSLVAGSNVTITNDASTVTISATGGSGGGTAQTLTSLSPVGIQIPQDASQVISYMANRDFNTDASGWTIETGATNSARIGYETYEGSGALNYNKTWAYAGVGISTPVTLKKSQDYTLSFYYYPATVDDVPTVEIRVGSKTGTTIATATLGTTLNAYARATVSFNSGSYDSYYLCIVGKANNNSVYHFDAFQFNEGGTAQAYGSQYATYQYTAPANTLPVKTLVAGSGISLSNDPANIVITNTGGLPTQTNNSGKYLTTDGTTASWGTVSTGEVNTLGTLGAGTTIVGAKSGTTLNTKSLVNGTGISITNDANTVTIASTVTAGEVNTLASLGSGTSIVGTKSGTTLNAKSLVAGTNVTLSSDANTVTINASGSGGTTLPTQTGNSGKYLTTDGTNLSWGTPAGGGSSNHRTRKQVSASGYTVLTTDDIDEFTGTGISILYLPWTQSAGVANMQVTIVNMSNNIELEIMSAYSENMNGSATMIKLMHKYDSLTLYCTGSEWIITNKYDPVP